MEGDAVRAGSGEFIDITDGVDNHEMDVKEEVRLLANAVDHRHAEGYIRYKQKPDLLAAGQNSVGINLAAR